jgi:hypothetical protein
MMAAGEFREDLYYRLKVIEVTVPPLRERRAEILHLTDFFMDRYARRYNRPVRALSPELHQLFLGYEWPGNIRSGEPGEAPGDPQTATRHPRNRGPPCSFPLHRRRRAERRSAEALTSSSR